jgi:hypothetical protein
MPFSSNAAGHQDGESVKSCRVSFAQWLRQF